MTAHPPPQDPAPRGAGRGIFDKDQLDRCISCGFCLPACPTYALTGDEASSPRGRITLMRALETGRLDEHDPTLAEQFSFCLGCRACETVCPAGVECGSLLEQWRDHQWQGRHRPWIARALMAVVSHRALLSLQGLARRHARARGPAAGPSLLLGCVERGLYPRVSRAVRQLRPEITVPAGQGCCGALHAHNGDSATGAVLAGKLGAPAGRHRDHGGRLRRTPGPPPRPGPGPVLITSSNLAAKVHTGQAARSIIRCGPPSSGRARPSPGRCRVLRVRLGQLASRTVAIGEAVSRGRM